MSDVGTADCRPRISVKSRCAACLRGEPAGMGHGEMVHSVRDEEGRATDYTHRCLNFDDECRNGAEGFGYYTVAWWPVRRRNGRISWLTWVERHHDGTFTLGNRAR